MTGHVPSWITSRALVYFSLIIVSLSEHLHFMYTTRGVDEESQSSRAQILRSRNLRRSRRFLNTTPEPITDDSSQSNIKDYAGGSSRPKVAFCFVGQFMRNAIMSMNVQLKFGSEPYRYDAFVATSDQHDEQRPLDKVNPVALCQSLYSLGFRACQLDLQPYNATVYHVKVAGLEGGVTNRLGLYPHRIASFFSTIGRSLDLVLQFEEQESFKYDFIFVTRLDVVNLVRFSGRETKPVAKKLWWAAARKYKLVAAKLVCEQNMPCFDDRFWFGKRDSIMEFRQVYDRFRSVYERGWSCWPERMLHVYAESYVLQHDSEAEQQVEEGNPAGVGENDADAERTLPGNSVQKRLSPPAGVALVSDFVDLTVFKGFRSKYGTVLLSQASAERQAANLTPLSNVSNAVSSTKAVEFSCAEFTFAFARLRCELEAKKSTAKSRQKSRKRGTSRNSQYIF